MAEDIILDGSTTYTVTFTITNKRGVALKDASVYLEGSGTIITDVDGIATFTGVPATTNTVGYTITKTNYSFISGSFTSISSNINKNVSINKSTSSVSIDVYNIAEDTKLKDVTIKYTYGTIEKTTTYNSSSGGVAPLKLNEIDYGTLIITATKSGYNVKTIEVNIDSPTESIIIYMEQTTPSYYSVTFTVQDSDGSAIENASVTLDSLKQTTNSSGVAVFNNLQEANNLAYLVTCSGYLSESGTLDVNGEEALTVSLEDGAYTLEFTITDSSTSNAIANQAIITTYASVTTGISTSETIYTNENGVAFLDDIKAGTVSYSITNGSYKSVSSSIIIKDNQKLEVALVPTATTTYTIAFDVVYKANAAATTEYDAENVFITLGSFGTQYTDSAGEASFTNIPAGTYSYTAGKFGYQLVTGSIVVSGAASESLELYPLAQDIRVSVVSSNNEAPLYSSTVRIQSYDTVGNILTTSESTSSSSQNYVNVDDMYWGNSTIIVSKSGYYGSNITYNIGGNVIELEPPSAGGDTPSNYISSLDRQFFTIYLEPEQSPYQDITIKVNETIKVTSGTGSSTNTIALADIIVKLEGYGSLVTDKDGYAVFENVQTGRSLGLDVEPEHYLAYSTNIDTDINTYTIEFNYQDKIGKFPIKVKGKSSDTNDYTYYALENVQVVMSDDDTGNQWNGKTDINGLITFQDVPYDTTYSLTLSLIGYNSKTVSHQYDTEPITPIEFILVEETEPTVDVVIEITSPADASDTLIKLNGHGEQRISSAAVNSVTFSSIPLTDAATLSYMVENDNYSTEYGTIDLSSYSDGDTVTESVSLSQISYTLNIYPLTISGATLKGALFKLYTEDETSSTTYTDGDNDGKITATITGIPMSGELRPYEISKAGYVTATGTITLNPSNDNQNVR